MVLGRLMHYAVDAALVSTVVAGVRRSSGFAPDASAISDPTLRGVTERFLGVGETIFDMIQATAVNTAGSTIGVQRRARRGWTGRRHCWRHDRLVWGLGIGIYHERLIVTSGPDC
ncbi:putative fungal protein of unknown function (DUF1748) [Lyophyllum shimeji]|uniref:DUF1748-domain-containing protein n=1 Tax=Lyophyllum shimeji TaxID=47721 RepID=A0A9P3UPT1_LYOSH|nr:putative fungal protein of unknown function (DUF1748) [Lyophyllum shimeji]